MEIHESSCLNSKQQAVAMALASGKTITESSKEFDVTARVIYKWMHINEFKLFIANMRSAILSEALSVLTKHAIEGVQTIAALLNDEDSTVRLQAARLLFDTIAKIRQHVDLEHRVIALEEKDGLRIEGDEAGEEEGDGWEGFRRRRPADSNGVV